MLLPPPLLPKWGCLSVSSEAGKAVLWVQRCGEERRLRGKKSLVFVLVCSLPGMSPFSYLSFPICGMRLMMIFLVSLQGECRRNRIRCHIRKLTTEGLAVVSLDLPLLLFNHWVVSNSLRPSGPQNARLPWSLLNLMSIESVMPSNHLILRCPLLLLPSIFPSIRVFFQWISSVHQVAKVPRVSASASVLPMNIQSWFPLGLTGLISLQSKELSRVFSNTTVWNEQLFSA